ncbi:MAG: class I SAM-dependent methyltransferase, partial [Dehalococcoidia bacterium]
PDLAAALSDRLTLALGDAVAYLDGLEAPPDVVTLDPMFPPRAGTALSKKEMQALSLLLGAPEDSERLLDAALRSGARRVVLKRPLRAPALVAPGRPPPSTQLRGRSARFDVYVPPSRPGEA